ncbi:receptor-like protein 1 [Quercus lobata]|uniref:receptor-like protein 1 n=1 Tax=Quercus lobata TaxID=97700 RepID=UPI001244ECDA|nr:receptor-like protein 1 [Quercus lobata]
MGCLPVLISLDLSKSIMEGSLSAMLICQPFYFKVKASYWDGDYSSVIEENKIEIETENPSWVPLFQLKVLVLSNNCLNKFAGTIPEFLFYQLELEFLDISHNRLHGSFPFWLLENNTGLQRLHLQNNYFEGQFHLPPYQYKNLSGLDVSNNLLEGKLQQNIGKMIPHLEFLNLSHNHIEGIMDLSRNSFSGTIPYCLHNMTFGKIDNFYGSYYSLDTDLTFVLFRTTGSYKCLLNCDFEIYQPKEINTHIGTEFVMKYRSYFYKGGILDIVYGLDLSSNKLTGQIPPELGQLSQILVLNLSYNQLTGFIPKSFSNLTQLESLDLSHNNLSGEIPSTLIDLHFLEVFNVAHNNLVSKLPDRSGQFGTFENNSYEGNPFLCGPPLAKSCRG